MTTIGWQLGTAGASELTDSMVLPAGSRIASGDKAAAQVAPQIMFLLREDLEP